MLSQQHALLDAAIKVVGNRYHTTMLIAKRIRQLHHGARPQVPYEEADSFFAIAVREIAAGHLSFEPASPPREAPSLPAAISSNGTRAGDDEVVETSEATENSA
jgi:DNA-directed RNA polymerase omega subunit